MEKRTRIAGAVVRARRQSRSEAGGVHGLQVQVWSVSKTGDEFLGEQLTRADGSFAVALPRAAGRVRLVVLDRDGRRAHVDVKGRSIRDGETKRVRLRLADEALAGHLSRPTTLAGDGEHFVSRGAIEGDIERALGRLAAPGGREFAALRGAALCPAPDWDLIDRLYRDAPLVLRADPRAIQRFREGLSILELRDSERVRAMLEQPASHTHTEDSEWGGGAPPRGLRSGSDAFSADRSRLLLAAATHAVGADLRAGSGFLGLLETLCELRWFGLLHETAVLAFRDDDYLGHLRGLLGPIDLECGPDDAPGWVPRERPCIPFGDPALECVRELTLKPVASQKYTITAVTPPCATPGTTISIAGSGFTSDPGQVVFYERGSEDPIPVAATSWSDTFIQVVVPADATCGISLEILDHTRKVCGKFIDVYRPGDHQADFEGSATEVRWFRANGDDTRTCVDSGGDIELAWHACSANQVKVELLDEDGNVLEVLDPAPPMGTVTWSAPTGDTTTRYVARLIAEGPCPPFVAIAAVEVWLHRVPHLTIQGLEVTQGIQYYQAGQHLTDPTDVGPDNSLQLVTGKLAWVRVYASSGQDPAWDGGELAAVGGTLRVERIVGGAATLLGVLAPEPPGLFTARSSPTYTLQRGTLSETLNFIIPSGWMTGRLQLTAELSSPAAPCGGGSATKTTAVDVDLTQTLNIAMVAVAYNGPATASNPNAPTLTLPAPTLTDLADTLPWTLAAYPVATNYNARLAGTVTLTVPLDDPRTSPGSCSPNWGTFRNLIAAVRNADTTPGTWLWYGLFPAGVPLGVSGCAGGGVAGSAVGNQGTLGHELGHLVGRPHAPCGNVGGGDPGYPAYEPYDAPGVPNARLGEYGLDVRNGSIKNPNGADFMSYCGPRWVSIYGWQVATSNASFSPIQLTVGSGSGGQSEEPSPRPTTLVLGEVDIDGRPSVARVYTAAMREFPVPGRVTDLVAELLDDEGRRLSAARVLASQDEGGGSCGCDGAGGELLPPFAFHVSLAPHPEARTLRIRRGEEILFERQARSKRPRVAMASASIAKNGRLDLRWTYEVDRDAETEFWVQVSRDGGRTWSAVEFGLQGRRCRADLAHLAPGPARFRVLLHDGFGTAAVVSKELRLPARPPAVAILHPGEDEEVDGAHGLSFWGRAVDCRGEHLPVEALVWELDGEELGRGRELRLPALKGRKLVREVTLRARDRHGAATARRRFRVARPE